MRAAWAKLTVGCHPLCAPPWLGWARLLKLGSHSHCAPRLARERHTLARGHLRLILNLP